MYKQVGIIGTGRVARALALGLGPYSDAPPSLWGREHSHCLAAANNIGRCQPATSIEALASSCDLVAIAVTDSAIGEIVEAIRNVGQLVHAPLIFHVSGSNGAAILDPLQATGASVAAIHPAMTFTGQPAKEVARMKDACFAITGSDTAITQARRLVEALGGVAVEIAEDNRTLYHAALCHAANHLVTLFAGASQMLNSAGVDDAASVIAPLARAALENSIGHGLDALSGPILRGDAGTIRKHLAALETNCPEALPAYRAMAIATLSELDLRGGEPERLALHRLLAD